ncbi:MAG: hypothetical protein ACR2N2_02865 [Acidimicrobiia bacterium]
MSQDTPAGVAKESGPRLVHVAPLIPLFVVAVLAARAIRDNSFLWHVRAGEAQATAGEVLTVDPFSYTFLGAEWRTQSWLVELLYASLESTFSGLAWANWMVLIVGSVTVLFLGLAVYRGTRSPINTALVLLLAVWLMGPFIQPRPVLFSYALAAALVVVLQHRDKLLWTVVPIMWIWAGVHGSWAIGAALIILELLRTRDRRLLFAGIGAAVASLATAHGFGTWKVAVEFLGARDTLALMEEWQPPEFVDIVQAPFLLIIFGLLIAAIRGKITMRDLIVIIPFVILGVSSRRAVFPAAIVLIPWAALAIPELKSSAGRMSRAVVGGFAAVVGLLILLPMLVNPLGVLEESRFPTPELVEALGDDRAFHGDGEGGYLIYAEWPERLVYIDDRAELYDLDHFMEYRNARSGDYREAFKRWGIDVALVQIDWSLAEVLAQDGWINRAENEYFIVYGRP